MKQDFCRFVAAMAFLLMITALLTVLGYAVSAMIDPSKALTFYLDIKDHIIACLGVACVALVLCIVCALGAEALSPTDPSNPHTSDRQASPTH